MPARFFISNPSVASYLQWTGDNLEEFETFFQREYIVVGDDLQEVMSGTVIPLNQYFDGLGTYVTVEQDGLREVTQYGLPPYRYVIETP